MKIVIAGGGTGGHLYPGIALAREFQAARPGAEILFVGTSAGIESRVVPQEGFALRTIRAKGIVGKGLKAVRGFLLLPAGLIDSWRILRTFGPNLVVGVGGYASGPVIAAAKVMGIPSMILEQNVIPGRTNRLLFRWVDRIVTAFEASRSYFPGREIDVIGNPVRREISNARPTAPGSRLRILVFGGSQGSHAINQGVIDSLAYLEKKKIDSDSVTRRETRMRRSSARHTGVAHLTRRSLGTLRTWRLHTARPIWC